MGTKMQSNVTELIDQATHTFGSALQTGIRMQSEAARWWTDMLQEAASLQHLQHRAQGMMSGMIPNAQQNVGQFLTWVDRSCHTTLDIFSTAIDNSQNQSYFEAQRRMMELWQTSLGIMRANMQAMAHFNGRMVESWTRMAEGNSSQGVKAAEAAAESMRSSVGQTAEAGARAARAAAQAAAGVTAMAKNSAKSTPRRRSGAQQPGKHK